MPTHAQAVTTAPARDGSLAPSVRTAVVSDRRIVYEVAGTGEPAVVLIHGAFGSRANVRAQRNHLAARHRVLTIDLPGHGDSDVPESGFCVRDFARDVIGVCEDAGIERAVLCGHSMPVALEAATLRPALAAGVVLLDGVVLFPEPVRSEALTSLVPALETDSWMEALRGFFGRLLGPRATADLRARVLEQMGRVPRQMPACFMRDLMSTDFAAQLSASTCPLLYVHAWAPADLQRLRRLRPDALVGCVVGSGHWLSLQVPDQVNAMLDTFLEIVGSTD